MTNAKKRIITIEKLEIQGKRNNNRWWNKASSQGQKESPFTQTRLLWGNTIKRLVKTARSVLLAYIASLKGCTDFLGR